jgi:hypothetical protein
MFQIILCSLILWSLSDSLIFAAAFSQSLAGTNLNHEFHVEVASWLESSDIQFEEIYLDKTPFPVMSLLGADVGLHIIPTPKENRISPNLCKELTDDADLPFQNIIHLHQDVWNNKNEIVKARIAARVNRLSQSWYARKTNLKKIDILTATEFLETHHLWGATRARYNYGLFDKRNDELIAVATFSPKRHVRRGNDDSKRPYRSNELIRYCCKRDGRAVGGITKLIAGFCRDYAPDDIVTVIDRDWGDGRGWEGIGFDKVNIMPPLLMAVGDDGIRRYFVGAGIAQQGPPENSQNPNGDKNDKRKGRPGISYDLFQGLDQDISEADALDLIESHHLYPVYDSGVERRMLIVDRTKWEAQASISRKELGLEKIDSPPHMTTTDLWRTSTPSFPMKHYSPNTGIHRLLEQARQSDAAHLALEEELKVETSLSSAH